MSKYTTGEIAKLCGVTVRTVQYYDNCGILMPSELSEGGRRLYSEEDLKRMRVICFLREAGFSIGNISALFSEDKPSNIISDLLDQQERALEDDLAECRKKLEIIEVIKREIKESQAFSVESLVDVAHSVKERKKLTKMRWMMILSGIPVTAIQWTSIILWITNGLWWLFVIWAGVAIPWGIAVTLCYFNNVAYVCPECHEIFKPRIRSVFFAYHTPRMRKLTCPHCGRRGLCVEIYERKADNINE